MPQPLYPRYKDVGVHFGPGAITQANPGLALQVMDVITYFASAESQIAYTLGNIFILKLAEVEETIKDFLDTPNGKSQREKLLEAAADILDEKGLDELGALLLMIEPAQKKRNRLVHWISGFSSQIPDGILFEDPLDHLRERLAYEQHLNEHKQNVLKGLEAGIRPTDPMPEFDSAKYRKKILVYKEADFREMRTEIMEILDAFHRFNFVAHRRDTKFHQKIAEGLRSLPNFASAMARLKKRKSAPDR